MSTSPQTLAGKTILITGANNGIGLWSARGLAAQGAEIILVCRNADRGKAALADIAAISAAKPTLFIADLFSQQEIHRLAADVRSRYAHLDVLINNAGDVFSKRELTLEGIERTFALNHLAPFLLTNLLLDLVKAAPQGRVVAVSSEIHAGKLRLGQPAKREAPPVLQGLRRHQDRERPVTYELAHRLEGTKVTANAVSPGPSRTGFGNNLTGAAAAFPKVMKKMPFFHSAEKGARVVVYAASEPALAGVSGQFFMNSKPRKSKPITHDPAVAAQLWQLSAELTALPASQLAG